MPHNCVCVCACACARACLSVCDRARQKQSLPPRVELCAQNSCRSCGLPGDRSVMSVYRAPARPRGEALRSQLEPGSGWEPSVIILTSIRVMITINKIIHQAAFPLSGLLLVMVKQAFPACPLSCSVSVWGEGRGFPAAGHGAGARTRLSHCIPPSPQVRCCPPPLYKWEN